MPATASELFRFAVLRAPGPADLPPDTGIFPLSLTSERPSLETELLSSESPDFAGIARRFLTMPAFVSAARTDADLDALERIYAAALRRSRSDASLSRESLIDVAATAVPDLADLSARLGSVEDRIWSSFLAAYLTGEGDGAVGERLTRLARATALVEIATGRSTQQPAAALRGVPFLNVEVARRVRATHGGERIAEGHRVLRLAIASARNTLGNEIKALDTLAFKLRQISRLRRAAPAVPLPIATLPNVPAQPPRGTGEIDLPLSTKELDTLGADAAALLSRHRLDPSAALSAVIKSASHRIGVLAERALAGTEPVHTTHAALVTDDASLTRDIGILAVLRHGDDLLTEIGAYRPGIVPLPDEIVPFFPESDTPAEAGWPSRIRPIGILDLRLVRHVLTEYQLGEIAHIENVVAHEYRDRGHRRLKRTEETIVRESERRTESERSLETTERFELQQESQRTIEQEQRFEAGVNVTGSYGFVTVAANAGYSSGESQQDSEKLASTYAKEVTDKARQRVEQRVKEGRTRVTVEELEESNTHRFENQHSDQHVVGIYRFIDKIYEAQIFNYGRRLMFEFLVPEPAAVHRALSVQAGTRGLPPKVDPLEIGPQDLDPLTTDYLHYVKAYGAQDLEPPPDRTITVTTTLSVTSQQARTDATSHLTAQDKLTVPEGYVAKRAAWVLTRIEADVARPTIATLAVGVTSQRLLEPASTGTIYFTSPTSLEKGSWAPMSDESGQLPISVGVENAKSFAMNVAVECEPTPARLQRWRLDTFQRIQEAAEQRAADYREAQARAYQLAARDAIAGVSFPERNRRIERDELKRGCIGLLSNLQFTTGTFDAVRDGSEDGIPVLDIENALREGTAVRFFENAFEWSQMTYSFYPYFWGSRARWSDMAGASDDDPLHEQFLRAGFARVLVPVARKQEINVLNYLEVGASAVFDGLEGAVFADATYGAIIRALESSPDDPAQAVAEGDPWRVVVPTSLVKLQLPGEEGEGGLRGTG